MGKFDTPMADGELVLPEDFFFGAAMSGAQTEGGWNVDGKLENMWDTWSNLDAGAFHNRVGSWAGNDFMRCYREDLTMLKELGLDSFRTSIQWSRLLDREGKLNERGAAWYHELFATAREIGIEPFVTLYHFDLPTYLFERGGWENRETCEAYANYVEIALREFGGEIAYWFTFNEPIVEPENRYEQGIWYPCRHDFRAARVTQYHISLAHCLGVSVFRNLKAKEVVREDARIGLVSNFSPSYTRENPSDADLEAVRMNDGINNRWWLDLVTRGELPTDILASLAEQGVELPIRAGDDALLKQGVVDWLGCNYYRPCRVQAPAKSVDEFGNPVFADPYVWPEAVMNESRGWEMYPKGIYDFGMKCRDEYPDLEWFISENGIGIEGEYLNRDEQGKIIDGYRVDFVRDHLAWIARAINEGAKIRGYHYWALIDNWSWANAFKNRYGFIEVDLLENYARRPKQSAEWLKKVVSSHIVA